MLCRVCTVHIQPGKHALEHADYKGPTWQHGLDPTDHDYVCMCMCTRYIYIYPLKYRYHEVGIDHTDHLSEV